MQHLLENQPRGCGTQQPASQSGRGGVPMFRLLTCAIATGENLVTSLFCKANSSPTAYASSSYIRAGFACSPMIRR